MQHQLQVEGRSVKRPGLGVGVAPEELSPVVADAQQRGLWRPADLLPAQAALHSCAVEAAEHLGAVLVPRGLRASALSPPPLGPAEVPVVSPARGNP